MDLHNNAIGRLMASEYERAEFEKLLIRYNDPSAEGASSLLSYILDNTDRLRVNAPTDNWGIVR